MATFVLVHGAWHGSWCWKRVRAMLCAAGHAVFTPTLSGLGERSHLLTRDTVLETHIADIANLLRWEELSDVVLVAHSYGGFVARHVVDRHPDRIRHVVYLDAFVPEDGQSLNDHAPAFADMFRAQAREQGEGWRIPPVPSGVFAVNPEDAPWMDAQCTPHPLSTFEEPARLSGAGERVPASYVLAGDFPGSPFPPFAEAARQKGWPCDTLAGGHDLMLDAPGEVAALLMARA
jgi:pimeloyl-ACP methyl ester carboxylesterase